MHLADEGIEFQIKGDKYPSISGRKHKAYLGHSGKFLYEVYEEPRSDVSRHYIGPITNGDYSYLEFLSLFNTIEKTSSEPTMKTKALSNIKTLSKQRSFRIDLVNFIFKHPVEVVEYGSLIIMAFSVLFITLNFLSRSVIVSPLILFLSLFSSTITFLMSLIEKKRRHA